MRRTSSSSCQCSELNRASIASRPGVAALTSMTSAVTYPPRAFSSPIFAAYELSNSSDVPWRELPICGSNRSYSISRDARKAVMPSASSMVRCSSGILTLAICRASYLEPLNLFRPRYCLEQKLENFDVTFGLIERLAPCVEPMPAQEKRVRVAKLIERRAAPPCEARHVLIVLDDRNPLAMLVRSHTVQSLEHLET